MSLNDHPCVCVHVGLVQYLDSWTGLWTEIWTDALVDDGHFQPFTACYINQDRLSIAVLLLLFVHSVSRVTATFMLERKNKIVIQEPVEMKVKSLRRSNSV